jgi:hypothetical protein
MSSGDAERHNRTDETEHPRLFGTSFWSAKGSVDSSSSVATGPSAGHIAGQTSQGCERSVQNSAGCVSRAIHRRKRTQESRRSTVELYTIFQLTKLLCYANLRISVKYERCPQSARKGRSSPNLLHKTTVAACLRHDAPSHCLHWCKMQNADIRFASLQTFAKPARPYPDYKLRLLTHKKSTDRLFSTLPHCKSCTVHTGSTIWTGKGTT